MHKGFFQFSLRALLIAVAAVSIWLGIWVHKARRQAESVAALRKLSPGISIEYDFEFAGHQSGQNPPQKPFGSNLLDIDLIANVSSVTVLGWQLPQGSQFADSDVENVTAFSKLQHLRLDGAKVSDRGLACLGSLRDLKSLYLRCLPLTDEGLANLSHLDKLTALILDCEGINGSGFDHVASLPALRFLDLRAMSITDESLLRLGNSLSLREIIVSRERLTSSGIQRFQTAAPRCKLSYHGHLSSTR